MSKIAITDYFDKINPEKEILGELVGLGIGPETEVLIVWHEKINDEFCKNLPNLRGVQRYGVGYDNLDLDYLKSRNIIACNNPDYGVDEVSDSAVAMIMNISRGISNYNFQAKSYFNNWQENVNREIKRNSDTVVGIIGAGRIGGSVLMKCNALRYKTVFYDPYKERGYEKMIGSQRLDSLDELLAISDIVSIHTPLNDETAGIINKSFIKKMKVGSSLVNTARGGLIDHIDDLLDPLMTGHLNNVALDVIPNEPPRDEKLIELWRKSDPKIQGKIIINPHTSYFSQASIRELRTNAAKNALRIYKRETPFNLL
ncbi:MAG: NAD(P)-dependent oxidoreductase [Bacteroidota bacterium]